MKHLLALPLLGLLAAATAPADQAKPAPSPAEIAAAAPARDWIDIAPEDLLVMTLAPDARGKPRTVLIQLMPAPFSQGWVSNIRTMAKAHYWDGLAVYRVQDNYVTQWGDPADDEKTAKKLPDGLKEMMEADYVYPRSISHRHDLDALFVPSNDVQRWSDFYKGFPIAGQGSPDTESNWPVHCYGMVGVARGQRPSTGDGSTLYTVIGHAPRHLDRNIALAGRVIEGMEHLSSLPRGQGAQGFYEDKTMLVPILSVRLASDLPGAQQPHVQYLSTETESFGKYAEARANRRDPFFLVPGGGADICNIPVPIRRKP